MAYESGDRAREIARWQSLKNERASWFAHWQELSTYILPRNGRFFIQDRNRGGKRYNNIYDSTGTKALRTLAAGMMAGMTSPARPWFRLATNDPEMMKNMSVKVWCDDVTKIILDTFQRGNTYRALHTLYEELGVFGTAATVFLEDFNDVVRQYPLTAGEYAIATDGKGVVNTLYREFEMTVDQMVQEFGKDKVSPTVRSLSTQPGGKDKWIPVLHVIQPREDRDEESPLATEKAYESCYYEMGNCEADAPLRESGYDTFPALVPRWATAGGDIYGSSPGMEALGDIKQLQHEQLRKAQGIDYMTKPPLILPTGAKARNVDVMPGGISYIDTQTAGTHTMFETRLDLNHLLMDIQDVRGRINSAFFADLFLMLANSSNPQMTATEVAERHEEKLLMLGPVLERLNDELLSPLVDTTFARLMVGGLLPPPPPALQGVPLKVEFVSMLAQAQRAVGINSMDRFINSMGAVAQAKPEVLDNFNQDEWARITADSLGVNPKLLYPEEEVAAVRMQRAKAAQQAQQAAQLQQTADTAKTLATAPTNGGGSNALDDVIGMFSGYQSSGAVPAG